MPAVDRPTLALGNYSLARHRRDNVTQTRLREDRDAVWASTVDTTIRSVPLGSSAQKAERREAAYDIELLGVLTVRMKEDLPLLAVGMLESQQVLSDGQHDSGLGLPAFNAAVRLAGAFGG